MRRLLSLIAAVAGHLERLHASYGALVAAPLACMVILCAWLLGSLIPRGTGSIAAALGSLALTAYWIADTFARVRRGTFEWHGWAVGVATKPRLFWVLTACRVLVIGGLTAVTAYFYLLIGRW
jgi:hypothetical protein